MSKNRCFNFGEYGHYSRDCPKACNNTNIAQERQQNKKVKNILDLDNSSVSEECAMICMEVQHEDGDEDLVLYRDPGVGTEEYDRATYVNVTKIQREEEEVKCNMALCTNGSIQ